LVGMAAAFAGVSGGFSANLLLGTVDPLLAVLSEEAARIMDPTYTVNPTANYYFMFVSTFLIAGAGTWVTEKIVTLINEEKDAGNHQVLFNAINLSSGIYFYKLQAGDPSASSGQSFVQTKKMILLK